MSETNPIAPVQGVLAGIIEATQPDSILCCGKYACSAARIWQRLHSQTRLHTLDAASPGSAMPLDTVYDLALISDTLEFMPHDEAMLFLGQLRNYGTHRIAVALSENPDWAFTDFIGLGFQKYARVQVHDRPLTVYTYNLDTYNHARAWNNPADWANPEMWDKARW
jgi:hypothetical protein